MKLAIGRAGLAVLAPAALVGGLPAVAQDKGEIAVMLPAAGDPYFKLKSFGYVDEGEKTRLLSTYWNIPQRQIETSVVLSSDVPCR